MNNSLFIRQYQSEIEYDKQLIHPKKSMRLYFCQTKSRLIPKQVLGQVGQDYCMDTT